MNRMEKKRARHEKIARRTDASGLRAPPVNLGERDLLQSIFNPIFGTPPADQPPTTPTPSTTTSVSSTSTTSSTPTTSSTSTTSSSTTTSSTSSTSTTSSSSTSATPVVTQATVTLTPSSTPSSSSATPSATAHTAADFAHNTGAQAAVGVVCGLVGLVALVWLITFAVRRRQKKRDDREIFAALHTPSNGFHGSPDDADYQSHGQYEKSDSDSHQGLRDPVVGSGSNGAGAYGAYGAPPPLAHDASYMNPYPQQHTSPDYGAPLTPMPQPPSAAYAPAVYDHRAHGSGSDQMLPYPGDGLAQRTAPAQVELMRETTEHRPVSAMDPYGGMEYGGGQSQYPVASQYQAQSEHANSHMQ